MDQKQLPVWAEAEFQNWIKSLPWYSEFQRDFGGPPDLNDPQYDYRAAWQTGVSPEKYQYDQNRYHWPSQFKSEDHPTMWMEKFMQMFGVDPNAVGVDRAMGEQLMQKGNVP